MRVFIAVEVPDEVKRKLLGIGRLLEGKGVTIVKDNAIHLTLLFLGEQDNRAVESVKKALSEIDFSPFEAEVTGIGSFGGAAPRVIFAKLAKGADESVELYRLIFMKLAEHKVATKREDFVPHITLARVKERADFGRLKGIVSMNAAADFGRFNVGSIVLKRSILGDDGPVYENLYELKF